MAATFKPQMRWMLGTSQFFFASFLLHQRNLYEYQHRLQDVPGPSFAWMCATALNAPAFVASGFFRPFWRFPLYKSLTQTIAAQDVAFVVGAFLLWFWIGTKIDSCLGNWTPQAWVGLPSLLVILALVWGVLTLLVAIDIRSRVLSYGWLFLVRVYWLESLLQTLIPLIWFAGLFGYCVIKLRRIS
jgi:hypothetical protein